MMSVNPEAGRTGNDQAGDRPSLACGRQTSERDLLVLLLGCVCVCVCVCVVDGAAPSMLTHRETPAMATLSMGVRLG